MKVKDNLLRIRAFRDVVRFKDIVAVLLKYGFDGLVEKLGLPGSYLVKKFTKIQSGMTTWERIRRAIEELGPTYIKFGQILSMRPDLIPKSLLDELKELREDVFHEDFHLIKEVIEASFNKKIEDMFTSFERVPIAAGSLAQVHKAVLKETGETVAVKVQRPGIQMVIKSDLEILVSIARMSHERIEALRLYNFPGIVDEIRRYILKELDFTNEANNAQIFNQNFLDESDVHAPDVYIDYSNKVVLTMEFIEGEKISELVDIDGRKERIAKRGLEIVYKQILVDGFFHADPHSGNIRVLEGDVICLLDWGMVGRLTAEMRAALLDFVAAVVRKDSKKLLRTALSMAVDVPPLIDKTSLEAEIIFILDKVHSSIFRSVNVGKFLMDLVSLFREHRIQLRPDYVYMIKALMAIEATGKELCEDFDIISELRPLISKLLLKRYSSFVSDKVLWGKLSETLRLILNFPVRMDRFLNMVEGGRLSIDIHHKGIESVHWSIRIVGNRVTTAIIIASLVIGSSLVITSGIGPFLFGYPVLGIAGYVFSAVIGLWLVVHMILKRHL
ncbi:MAG: AarF/ABC1/UbiB kinase family protein [Deltaproteobacteria bacterium]|nr:AarF/ABC1/UbiB kinase family protein [Deltaproteobacteria bacterium]MBW2019979.1 AarF/ABC1/UbiB kinase family protein [Deltaproteobacteria bacterium]MBW2075040.1 AarF/ABC1/UbiB kinase family protein [Deltaproteobacteria bacterium]RLB84039.1 MAG: AarF/ABC1/UbiB kinase family protein [Deltaproteobacteria bacterium]